MSGEFTNLSIGSIRCTGPTVRYLNEAAKGADAANRGGDDDCDELVAKNLKFDKVTFNGGLLQMMAPLCFEELQHTKSAIVREAGNAPLPPIEDSDAKAGPAVQSGGAEEPKKEASDEERAENTETGETLKMDHSVSEKVESDSKTS